MRWGCAPIVTADGGGDGATPNTSQNGVPPPGARTRVPFPPYPACCLLTMVARPVLTGTSERAADRALGFGAASYRPTTRASSRPPSPPPPASPPAGTAARARCAAARKYMHVCTCVHVHGHCAAGCRRCRRCRRRTARASRPRRPQLTPPRLPHCGAGHSAAKARPWSGTLAGGGGRRAAGVVLNGRRALAQVIGAGRAAVNSAAGAHGANGGWRRRDETASHSHMHACAGVVSRA